MTTNRRNSKAMTTQTEPQLETLPEAPSETTAVEPSTAAVEPEPTESTQPATFPSLTELQALPIVEDLANDWLLNNLQLAVAMRVRQMLNSSDPAEQYRVRNLLETMTFTLAAGALHNGLQHAITASKESLQTMPATADA